LVTWYTISVCYVQRVVSVLHVLHAAIRHLYRTARMRSADMFSYDMLVDMGLDGKSCSVTY
jgi:hypothetical protein